MFIPIRTDRRLQHTPWMNHALIAANVVIFLWTHRGLDRAAVDAFMLHPEHPALRQFITYQFLHADWLHLAGNMLFLWVFGNSVEDRLGKIGYLAFYLAGGVLAGLGHSLSDANPVLGASGSVAAVTGAYLALFPLSNVTVVYWFIVIGAFQISSMLLIGFQIAQNVFFHVIGGANVAYLAHLCGYAYGFAVGMGMLKTRLLPREPYDMLALIEHRRRRQQFAALTRRGYRPWEANAPGEPPKEAAAPDIDEAQRRIMTLRSQISNELFNHNMPHAAQLYDQLLDLDGGQVMSQQQQLDLANQLMSEGNYRRAAKAYELFLNTYGGYAQREQVQLILGLIYARYLDRRQRAKELLSAAIPRLNDRDQRDLAQQILAQMAG